jgi:predicted transcriptional regulator
VTEQRYKAVLAVIADGRTVSEVASEWGVCRQTMHRWLARYEDDGLEGLGNRSSRPAHCPHQTSPAVEVMVLEMRRSHPYWGARRIALELARKGSALALTAIIYSLVITTTGTPRCGAPVDFFPQSHSLQGEPLPNR